MNNRNFIVKKEFEEDKMKLLYIGNKLAMHGMTATSIETLGVLLEEEGFTLMYASSKKHNGMMLVMGFSFG